MLAMKAGTVVKFMNRHNENLLLAVLAVNNGSELRC